jgi:hypothetical protein
MRKFDVLYNPFHTTIRDPTYPKYRLPRKSQFRILILTHDYMPYYGRWWCNRVSPNSLFCEFGLKVDTGWRWRFTMRVIYTVWLPTGLSLQNVKVFVKIEIEWTLIIGKCLLYMLLYKEVMRWGWPVAQERTIRTDEDETRKSKNNSPCEFSLYGGFGKSLFNPSSRIL